MGGSVHVTSKEGQGSEFSINLKLKCKVNVENFSEEPQENDSFTFIKKSIGSDEILKLYN